MVISMKSKVIENKKNKKNALLKSAFELFLKKDIHEVTVQDITKNANVAKGTIYIFKINTKFVMS